MLVQILLPGEPKRNAKSIRKIRQENPWCQSAMGPSPQHRGREARASPQSPEAQGLWKVLPWDLRRDSGGMVFTGQAAGVGGAAAPTSCQNKDQDGECWVCPLWVAWYVPPTPTKARAPCGTGLLRPWGCSSPAGCACLPGGHTCHQASMQSVLPGHWGDAQQLYHFVSSQANLSISYDLLFRNQNVKPLRTRWSEAGGWFWRGGLGLS